MSVDKDAQIRILQLNNHQLELRRGADQKIIDSLITELEQIRGKLPTEVASELTKLNLEISESRTRIASLEAALRSILLCYERTWTDGDQQAALRTARMILTTR